MFLVPLNIRISKFGPCKIFRLVLVLRFSNITNVSHCANSMPLSARISEFGTWNPCRHLLTSSEFPLSSIADSQKMWAPPYCEFGVLSLANSQL